MKVWLMIAIAVALIAPEARATSTTCSNPKREQVLATARVALPTRNIEALEQRFELLAPKIGMTTWGVAGDDGRGIRDVTLGLQSPKVSVGITAEWRTGQKAALLQVERTCINDALEPWQPYWKHFLSELREAGYVVR
jgi:hypothetical protein